MLTVSRWIRWTNPSDSFTFPSRVPVGWTNRASPTCRAGNEDMHCGQEWTSEHGCYQAIPPLRPHHEGGSALSQARDGQRQSLTRAGESHALHVKSAHVDLCLKLLNVKQGSHLYSKGGAG